MRRDAFRDMLVVGVEDGSFQKGITRKALLAVVLFKGLHIEDVRTANISVDGLDATKKLVGILNEWRFTTVLLAGISFAGFNVIDPTAIYESFKKPVIVITRTKPNSKTVKQALKRHFTDWETRWNTFAKLNQFHKILPLVGGRPIYIEILGANIKCTHNLIRALSVRSRVPEPIRVARLVARGLS